MKKAFLTLGILSLICVGCSGMKNVNKVQTAPVMTAVEKPRNVIFVVGDGMGTAQVYSSIIAMKGNSNFMRFPFTGFSKTNSRNKYTTDSAAGGSALMTGQKCDNYHVACSPMGDTIYPSILVQAKENGMAAGFVVTCSVCDATPASTYAHVTYRKMFDTISYQMTQSNFDVMIGGNKNLFVPEHRKDGLSLLDTLNAKGYDLVYDMKSLNNVRSNKLCALLSNDDPGDAGKRDHMLADGTRKAISILENNPKGFVLMVEGSQIDWAGHNNDSSYMRKEMMDFEEALKVILDWAEKDGNTLVVVTADHETGGTAVIDGDVSNGWNEFRYITGNHTGVMVPVFAFGPGASRFTGIQENVEVHHKIIQLLGLPVLSF